MSMKWKVKATRKQHRMGTAQCLEWNAKLFFAHGRCGSSCFFFSSRRRHTRCSRDWSSDVCSSDLARERRCVEIMGEIGGAIARVDRRDVVAEGVEHRALSRERGGGREQGERYGEIGRASCRERV